MAEKKVKIEEEYEEEPIEEKKSSGKKIGELEDLPGVGAATAEKLREAGFKNVESVAVAAPGELMDASGIGEAVAKKIIMAARDSLDMGFETAEQLMEKRKCVSKIVTGSKELDTLLGGGIETQSITEMYGRFGSGKTQVALQLCANVMLPVEQGGLGGSALFIDSEGTFRPERLEQMAKAVGLDPKVVLEKTYVAKAYNSDHQMLLAEKAEDIIEEKEIRLIVVDSLTSAFRAEYVGRGTLADRQQKINRHMHVLQKAANLHNLAIVVTNQVMANPGLLFGDPTTPIGGNIVGHKSTYRIYLRKGQGEKRIARLVDSPCLPDGECVFKVSEGGVQDA